MKALIFGQSGQVAQALAAYVPPGVQAVFLGRTQADLTRPETCAAAITQTAADVVINAAAYTAVDRAESEATLADLVNGDAPGAMATAAAARGLPFLHLSSDYVFSGAGTAPHKPEDPIAPLSAYGRSKARGEALVQAAGGRALILRTSWVFSATGQNFVKTMLRLGAERPLLRVVADQIGGPTPAAAIAAALWQTARAMAEGAPGGVHHFAGAPDCSWADFAGAIMEDAGLSCQIEPIPSSEYPTPAPRPLNSRLDCESFTRQFGIQRPDWRAGLADVLRALGAART